MNIGTKYALLIGNNYKDNNSLMGCHNDIDRIETRLTGKKPYNIFSKFKNTDIEILKDATRDEILNGFQNLISKINLEKINEKEWLSCIIYIHFSGHGTWIPDKNKDELDNKDECIVGNGNSIITDDEIYQLLLTISNPNAKIIISFDCCHSGTGIDLGYNYNRTTQKYQLTNNKLKNIKPNILFFSGCKDEQTSADAYLRELGDYGGAFTQSLLDKDWLNRDIFDLLEDNKTSLSHIIEKINNYMIMNSFTQRPCLSTNMSIILDNDYLDNIDILNHFYIDKEPNNNIDFILPQSPNINIVLSPIDINQDNIDIDIDTDIDTDIDIDELETEYTPISTNDGSYIDMIYDWIKNTIYYLYNSICGSTQL